MLTGLFLGGIIVLSFDLFFTGQVTGFLQQKVNSFDLFKFLVAALTVSVFLELGVLTGKLWNYISSDYSNWYAATIFFVLTLKLVHDGRSLHKTKKSVNPLNPKGLIALTMFSAINAFLAGMGFGLINMDIKYVFLSFLIFYILILAGYIVGLKIRQLIDLKTEYVAAVVFITIAIVLIVNF